MCGIYFCYHYGRKDIVYNCDNNRPRGPDATKAIETDNYLAKFYRLAIVDVAHGMQPFESEESILLCNGEIYNHEYLENTYTIYPKTKSDCECIMDLYEGSNIETTVQLINGEWAFVLYDKQNGLIHFARDRLGRKPLFYSDNDGIFEVSSLFSGLSKPGVQVIPGQVYTYDVKARVLSVQRYHSFKYISDESITDQHIYDDFVNAVKIRVQQTERPLGFLLSGGFDSSLVLSIALYHKFIKTPPHVFTFGFDEKAPDVLAAECMVKWLRNMYGEDCIIWHKVIRPVSEGIDALPEVVKALETYDTTTIRASTPMYLLCKYIAENTDVKVILSGEGSDELFGGYLYFKYAPNDMAFRSEILRLLNELYLFDVLRADRSSAAHGLEIRTPFLDDTLVATVLTHENLIRDLESTENKQEMTIPSKGNTKALIRRVMFGEDILPLEILSGKKEAFSDAVGFSWKDTIAQVAGQKFRELSSEMTKVPINPFITADTDESKYYQLLFMKHFGSQWHLLPHLWLPNQKWVKTGSEPSARALKIY